MIRLLRNTLALITALACLSLAASADVKIKTRTTVMGHSSESTVYIKGPRQRSDMNFGGHGGAATIIQCDQKRMITISGDRCMVMPMGGAETSCPTVPSPGAMGRNLDESEPTPARKGGVVTITRTSTDTGERQEMLGYKARHIKTSMTMESSPDACNQSHMKMETDGWYADLSAGFSCGDESYRSLACGGMGRRGQRCNDRIVVKGGGERFAGLSAQTDHHHDIGPGNLHDHNRGAGGDHRDLGCAAVRDATGLQGYGHVGDDGRRADSVATGAGCVCACTRTRSTYRREILCASRADSRS